MWEKNLFQSKGRKDAKTVKDKLKFGSTMAEERKQ